jgi:hypothetical protein
MRSGRFSVNSTVFLTRSEGQEEGIVSLEVGTVSAEVYASDLIERLRLMGAFAKSKCAPPAIVNRQLRADSLKAVDAWNETFPRKEISAQRNAPFAEKALLHGYDVVSLARVFLAIKQRSTPAARWIQTDGKRWFDFPHCVRPPYKDPKTGALKPGLPHMILAELDNGATLATIRRTSEEEI